VGWGEVEEMINMLDESYWKRLKGCWQRHKANNIGVLAIEIVIEKRYQLAIPENLMPLRRQSKSSR
jgi:hypothetical protein